MTDETKRKRIKKERHKAVGKNEEGHGQRTERGMSMDKLVTVRAPL